MVIPRGLWCLQNFWWSKIRKKPPEIANPIFVKKDLLHHPPIRATWSSFFDRQKRHFGSMTENIARIVNAVTLNCQVTKIVMSWGSQLSKCLKLSNLSRIVKNGKKYHQNCQNSQRNSKNLKLSIVWGF